VSYGGRFLPAQEDKARICFLSFLSSAPASAYKNVSFLWMIRHRKKTESIFKLRIARMVSCLSKAFLRDGDEWNSNRKEVRVDFVLAGNQQQGGR
jgi:hypothetical protein